MTLVIGAASNDPTSVAVANTAADQLRNAGVRASVLALDPPTLYGQAIPDGRVDAIVGWHQAAWRPGHRTRLSVWLPGAASGEAARHSHHDAATAAYQ